MTMGRCLLMVTALTAVMSGCHTTGLPKEITGEQLQANGVIAGSFLTTTPDGRFWSGMSSVHDRRFVLTSTDTGQHYRIQIGSLKEKDIVDQETSMSGAPFACVVPPGRYKFDGWYVELRSGDVNHQMVKQYWSNASVPVSIEPGEIRYIGRLLIPIDKTAWGITPVSASSDDRRCVVKNSSQDDLPLLQDRYPNLPWDKTMVSMELLRLKEPNDPPEPVGTRWEQFMKALDGNKVPAKFGK